MASQCLSSVLTNANFTMYQNSLPDLLPHQANINNQQNGNLGYGSNNGERNDDPHVSECGRC